MIEQIKEILLRSKGKKHQITSKEIAKAIGISENDTFARTRALIFQCASTYKLPLAADARGYYLITNKGEYEDYIKNLDARIEGIRERKRIITENYRQY